MSAALSLCSRQSNSLIRQKGWRARVSCLNLKDPRRAHQRIKVGFLTEHTVALIVAKLFELTSHAMDHKDDMVS